ncbi:MAG TPA: pilus assembly protein TadG-related protein [Actinomycetota bacterium]|nr:pilus assembly protein TadG-related protein [Actinomycetota bacterium]
MAPTPRTWFGRFALARARDERGAVVVVVALFMSLLILLAAGGITGFTLYAAHREMQRSADQAALAGAAAFPPFNPYTVLDDSTPFPLPNTDPTYHISGDPTVDIPQEGEQVPDPRAVACAYGQDGLSPISAPMLSSFGDPPSAPPPTVCADTRVRPSMESNAVLKCVDGIVGTLRNRIDGALASNPDLAPYMPAIHSAVHSHTQALTDGLNQSLPAVFAPRMKVDIVSGIKPPLLSLLTGDDGVEMRVSATASRSIKNAIVLNTTSHQHVWDVIGDDTELNNKLKSGPAITTLQNANTHLNNFLSGLGISGCQNMMGDLESSLRNLFEPPTNPKPKVVDFVAESVLAANIASARTGVPVAGDTFIVIGAQDSSLPNVGNIVKGVLPTAALQKTATDLLGNSITTLQIPVVDVAFVVFTDLGGGNYRAHITEASNAPGAFRASLVK